MSLHDKPCYGYILLVYQTQLLQLSIRGYNEDSPQMGWRTTNETEEIGSSVPVGHTPVLEMPTSLRDRVHRTLNEQL